MPPKKRARVSSSTSNLQQPNNAGPSFNVPPNKRTRADSTSKPPQLANALPRKLGLNQVYPNPSDTSRKIDIDIVAIHGLDTHSPKTWVRFKNGRDETDGVVHWLQDPDMLPSTISTARIFTYDWNANFDREAATESLLGHADGLLLQLQMQREEAHNRPIIFVASCFGGLLLCKALHRASGRHSKYSRILDSTVGVTFLGTPFRGSSDGFLTAAQLRLKVAESMGGETANELIKYLSRNEQERKQLDDAVQEFCELAKASTFKDSIYCFYETQKSSGDHGILVPKYSACLDFSNLRVGLPVRHALLNKFSGPDDIAFQTVSYSLKEIADQKIQSG
ncbi:hypothetical protein J3458_013427 [Metarhizium acridum]|uniref:uncharacterized protein n=1 Tax=Metarhizium acridum TaxID=92637 RepID=UPI001C6AD7E6|nr:hypothetical protein J3458_013427 [Metarhizium acridum]